MLGIRNPTKAWITKLQEAELICGKTMRDDSRQIGKIWGVEGPMGQAKEWVVSSRQKETAKV